MGNDGPITVKVPFSISDVSNWKVATGSYRDDAKKVASAFEMMIRTRNPDWQDIEAILQVVFDSTERDMIWRAVRTHLQAQIAAGTL